MTKRLERASFTDIYHMLKDERHSRLWQCFRDVFGVALLFFPGFMCKETALLTGIGDGLNLAGAAGLVGKAAESVAAVFGQKEETDFTQRYDRMRIAQVLLVYSAYFDSMKLYLPDEMGQIALSEKEKYTLTQEAVSKYREELQKNADRRADGILLQEILPPDPVRGFEAYIIELKSFYQILNREFAAFFGKLSVVEKRESYEKDRLAAVLLELPERAVQNYRKQYFELAAAFPDFNVWANQQEQHATERRIDVGFAQMHEWLDTYEERHAERRVVSTFEKCTRNYELYIEKPVISQDERNLDPVQLTFPGRKEIFIPQSFRALNYEHGCHLENEEMWEQLRIQEEVAPFIRGKLLHPSAGQAPLIILGHPGAGKTLLCHMLAAQSLCNEFYTLIIRLRDTDADQTVMQQINQQIERDLGGGCDWNDIASAKLTKPVLFIFDGYDELLQASGRTYANYLSSIAEFQQQQSRLHGMLIRCMVTSRISLIDKAVIPKGSTIIRLGEFDDRRISLWCEIWNERNAPYFAQRGLAELELDRDSSVYMLARQPLLLLMLALYDSENNALKHQADLSLTQLYENLIEEFVAREKRKEKSFRECTEQVRQDLVEKEVSRIGVAALGMYNRRALFIRSEDLNRDLSFFEKGRDAASERNDAALSDSEVLLGSFFFIHKSESADGAGHLRAYEFLHNTFGEFLTARLVLEQLRAVADKILMFQKMKHPVGWSCVLTGQYHAALMYAPLFARPVVLSMIGGYYQFFFEKKGISREKLVCALDLLMEREIRDIVSGEKLVELKQAADGKDNPYASVSPMEHLAIYSMNLILIRTVLGGSRYELDTEKYGQEDLWNRLLCIWNYAFSPEDFLSLGEVFHAWKAGTTYVLQYAIMPQQMLFRRNMGEEERLEKTYLVSKTLGDSKTMALAGTLLGAAEEYGRVQEAMEASGLDLSHQHMWNTYLRNLWNPNMTKEEKLYLLENLGERCRMTNDLTVTCQYYLLLCSLAETKLLPCRGKTVDEFLEEEILKGLEALSREGWMVIGTEETHDSIQKLLFRLIDCCNISAELFFVLLRASTGRGYGRFGISFGMHRIYTLGFLGKAAWLAVQTRYRKYVKHISMEDISELPRYVWADGRYDKYTCKYLPDALTLCQQMVLYGQREYGLRMLAMLLEPLSDHRVQPGLHMNEKLRIKIADCLVLLLKYKELPVEEIVLLRQEYVGNISGKKLLEESQDSLWNYCCLLNLENEPDI